MTFWTTTTPTDGLQKPATGTKPKLGSMLLMGRGTPCIYYGTELGFDTRCEPDGKVRQDFPGGWPEDDRNAFSAEERTPQELEWFNHVHGSCASQSVPRAFQGVGHFFPKRGVYGFSREQDDARIVTLVNAADEARLAVGQPCAMGPDAVAMQRLQPDGTLASDVLKPRTPALGHIKFGSFVAEGALGCSSASRHSWG